MNNTQLYIPKKCKVGFNLRPDTYTGKLGYIIYHDGKVWRKEKSWEDWRQKEGQPLQQWENGKYITIEHINGVEPIEFDNVPTEGFVLNKKAGGYSSGWNHRQTYSRVYDPRGWEFEITVPNLLYILQECSSFKGKGLEGTFVYSWDGKDLVLIPTTSPDYLACEEYTDLQSKKVGKKDLALGCTYLTSKQEKLIYLGQYSVCEFIYNNRTPIEQGYDKHEGYHVQKPQFDTRYVFRHAVGQINKYSGELDETTRYEFLSGLSRLKAKITETAHPDFANYVDEFENHTSHTSLADHLEIGPIVESFWERLYYRNDVYLYGEINTVKDMRQLKRELQKSDTEFGKYNIFNENMRDYAVRFSDRKPELSLTREEVEANYGLLMRVYKNGYKVKV